MLKGHCKGHFKEQVFSKLHSLLFVSFENWRALCYMKSNFVWCHILILFSLCYSVDTSTASSSDVMAGTLQSLSISTNSKASQKNMQIDEATGNNMNISQKYLFILSFPNELNWWSMLCCFIGGDFISPGKRGKKISEVRYCGEVDISANIPQQESLASDEHKCSILKLLLLHSSIKKVTLAQYLFQCKSLKNGKLNLWPTQ